MSTVVSHLAYEVPKHVIEDEVKFWTALGFTRAVSSQIPKPIGRWLNGHGVYVHLMPVDPNWSARKDWNHVAIVPKHGLDATLDSLERLPLSISAEHGSTHWGSRRVFVMSPAGYRVELLEYAPPARWSGAPLDD